MWDLGPPILLVPNFVLLETCLMTSKDRVALCNNLWMSLKTVGGLVWIVVVGIDSYLISLALGHAFGLSLLDTLVESLLG